MSIRRPLGLTGNAAAWLAPLVLLGVFVALGANGSLLGTAASLAAFVAAAVVIVLLPPRPGFWLRLCPVLLPFALALGWAALPLLLAGGGWPAAWIAPGTFAASFATLAGILIWVPTGAMMGATPRVSKRAIDVLIVLAVPWIVLSVIAYKIDPGRVWGVSQGLPRPRYSATLLNPNTAACALAMIGVLAAGRFMDAAQTAVDTVGNPQKRAIVALAGSWLVLMLALVAMALAGSRLAMAMAGISVAVLAVQARRLAEFRSLYYGACVSAVLLPLVAGGVIGGMRLARKMGAIEGDAALRREDLAHYWDLSLASPWFGHGLGAFRQLNASTLDADHVLHRWNFGAAHNVLIHGALEGGWPFAVLAAAGVVAGMVVLIRSRAVSGFDSPMYALILAVTIALACGIGDIALNVPALAAFATWLGGLAVGRAIRASTAAVALPPADPAAAEQR